MSDVDQLRQEVRRISTTQLRADVATLQGDVAGLDHGADLAGLADNDHTQYPLKSIATTKGDLWVATGAGTLVRLAVGSNDDVLTADSGEASGVKWATGGTWGSWSPSYANLTIGSGTVVARYVQIGQTVHAYFSFVLGSTSAVGTAPTVSTPVTASSSYLTGQKVGVCSLFDSGTNEQDGMVTLASTTTFGLFWPNLNIGGIERITEINLGATVPFTWATGDSMSFAVTFEASA